MWALVGCAGGSATGKTADSGSEPAIVGLPEVPVASPASSRGGEPTPDRQTGRHELGILGYAVTVYSQPKRSSHKLGYLRVGAKVARLPERSSRRGCKGGWYKIEPRGYVCAGEQATVDLEHPILRAASVRPRLDTALPYRYGFVRAVLPLYLRVPTARQQYRSEFKLREHLGWFKENGNQMQNVALGAPDVSLDARGVVTPGKMLGELGHKKNSTELSLPERFGAQSANDPWPFWLRPGRRLIANISGFHVPESAIFADRVRRHTGLAFVGSFSTDEHHLRRRFAITTDLRLAPTTKIKPDSASPWHGVELRGAMKLPIAFVSKRGARAYAIVDGKASATDDLERRAVFRLSGKAKKVAGEKYYQLSDQRWVFQSDVGIAVKPRSWPRAARRGGKWIEIDLSEQILVLWNGKTPEYATLVSTGRPAIGDPKKTNATPRGVFNIYAKHITATMDSDQGSARKRNKKASLKPGDEGYVPQRGDGSYGVTKRRGHGLFKLRDVPHIQYFKDNFALHGTYWHDVFGIPRSHGCINLAPVDSLRVFQWTEPKVPENWHGINTDRGTPVLIHK